MCKWGISKEIMVHVSADLSCTGKDEYKLRKIDICITSIVKALDDSGIFMRGSCCGHGKADGKIDLQDGRTLIVKKKL